MSLVDCSREMVCCSVYVLCNKSANVFNASLAVFFVCGAELNFPFNKFTNSVVFCKICSSTEYSGIGMTVGIIDIVSDILVERVFGI